MRAFALATSRPAAFSVGGTLNVTLAGAITGILGSVLLITLRRLLPARRLLRGLVFAALCYLVASPGFRPPRPLVFALFGALFVAYGVVLVILDARLGNAEAAAGATTLKA